MSPAWIVEFYEDEAGCPVRDYLDSLDRAPQAKVVALITLLEEQGPMLPFPYSSQVRGKIGELRTQFAGGQHRVLYFGDPERRLALLHAFAKQTAKIPARDIQTAANRMARWLARLEKQRGQR